MNEKNLESHVDTEFGWKKFREGLWQCKYYPDGEIGCTNRQCDTCGWNPEVSEARTAAIMKALKESVENKEDEHGKESRPA